MNIGEKLKLKLQERIRVYQDSPGLGATYADLKHFAEDLLDILDSKNDIGFKKQEGEHDKTWYCDQRYALWTSCWFNPTRIPNKA